MRVKLEEVFAVLPMLDENNLDDVLQTMEAKEADIETMSDVNALSKFMALSLVSVAMESTKLWHGIFFDEKNALREICGNPDWMIPLFLPFLISADMIGVLMMPLWLPALFVFSFIVCLLSPGSMFCDMFNLPLSISINNSEEWSDFFFSFFSIFAPPILTSYAACIAINMIFVFV